MALEINLVAVVSRFAAATENMVVGNFVERGRRSEGADVTTHFSQPRSFRRFIGFDNHRHRVPANEASDPPLDFSVARILRCVFF